MVQLGLKFPCLPGGRHRSDTATVDLENFRSEKNFINVAIYENLTYKNFSPKLTTRYKNCIR